MFPLLISSKYAYGIGMNFSLTDKASKYAEKLQLFMDQQVSRSFQPKLLITASAKNL